MSGGGLFRRTKRRSAAGQHAGRVEIKARMLPSSSSDGTRRRKPIISNFVVRENGATIGPDPKRQHAVGHLTKLDLNGMKIGMEQGVSCDEISNRLRIAFFENKYWCLPNNDAFSSHTGTCRLLGNKRLSGPAYPLKVGDFVRLGSVGLVISEIRTHSRNERLSSTDVQKLRTDMRYIESNADGHLTDVEDEDADGLQADQINQKLDFANRRQSVSSVCYICYEEDSEDNPLLAPCQCKGDTKYVHYNCVQHWALKGREDQVCLQTSTIDGVSCCTICKSPYKSEVRSVSGKILSLSTKLRTPSISLVVITSHEQEPRLTNMNYQISFASLLKSGDNDNATKAITIGRSTSQCDMSIKYRTVSSCHAKMEYIGGEFLLSDLKSSNGTLVFVRQPVELAYGQLTHIKLGRTILTMQAKHSWAASTCIPQCFAACTSASQVQPVDDVPSLAETDDVFSFAEADGEQGSGELSVVDQPRDQGAQ